MISIARGRLTLAWTLEHHCFTSVQQAEGLAVIFTGCAATLNCQRHSRWDIWTNFQVRSILDLWFHLQLWPSSCLSQAVTQDSNNLSLYLFTLGGHSMYLSSCSVSLWYQMSSLSGVSWFPVCAVSLQPNLSWCWWYSQTISIHQPGNSLCSQSYSKAVWTCMQEDPGWTMHQPVLK